MRKGAKSIVPVVKIHDPPNLGGSWIVLGAGHLIFDGITDEAVQALALTGGKILDDFPLSFFTMTLIRRRLFCYTVWLLPCWKMQERMRYSRTNPWIASVAGTGVFEE